MAHDRYLWILVQQVISNRFLADGQCLCRSLLALQNGPQMVKVHRLRQDQVISLLIPFAVTCIPHLERPIFPGIHWNKWNLAARHAISSARLWNVRVEPDVWFSVISNRSSGCPQLRHLSYQNWIKLDWCLPVPTHSVPYNPACYSLWGSNVW